jgi:membrane protease YdiL (CAAX protease family)
MRLVKWLFKLVLILLIPYTMQILVSIGLAIQMAVVLTKSGIKPEMLGLLVSERILEKMVLIVGLASVLTLLIFFIASAARGKSFKNDYAFNKISLKHILFSIAITITGYMLSLGINGAFDMASLDPNGADSVTGLVMNESFPITLFVIGLLVPFVEELVFRGAVLRNLKKQLPIAWVIVIQAALFGAYHLNLIQGFAAFFLGLNMGLAVYFSGSLWAGILIHSLNNSLSVIISRILPQDVEIDRFVFIILLVLGLTLSIWIQKMFYQSKVHSQIKDSLIEVASLKNG